MDIMKFKTKLGKRLVSEFISTKISEKYGCMVNLNFDEFEVTNEDDHISFRIKVYGVANNNIATKLLE